MRASFTGGQPLRPASTLRADVLLLVAAAIWGFAFVAQRAGMDHVGPFTFNGARFLLGALALLPFIGTAARAQLGSAPAWRGGILAGTVLFLGASLQQWGIVSTTAGKAGFITGLYVIVVPLIGLLLPGRGQTGPGTWLGAALAVAGLYLLSVKQGFSIGRGDLLVLGGAVIWAAHVIVIGVLTRRFEPRLIAFQQFLVCGLLSAALALASEPGQWVGLPAATLPVLYAGLFSTAVAFTLQVVAQRDAHPSHAAVLLSLEAVFAVIGGWLLLGEMLSTRGLIGCALMLTGMLASQLWRTGGRAASV
jgi:drug/metabolite transporter (DMT)-like permease